MHKKNLMKMFWLQYNPLYLYGAFKNKNKKQTKPFPNVS